MIQFNFTFLISKESGKSYLLTIFEMFEKVVKHCSENCLICGNELSYASVKPSFCENPVCAFTYEQYDLGFDIES
jgi:hypothetical protein